MATACIDEFDSWLCTKLVNTDQDVFVSYIRGILEGDEAKDEKLEGLEGILIEIMSDNTSSLSHEILDRWDKLSPTLNSKVPAELEVDVNAKLASIMEKQTLSVVTERKITEAERQYKDAILAQYSHVSDGDDDDDDEAECVDVSPANPTSSGGFVTKNTNAEDVARAEKEKRDKAKGETEKKKAADKANKEKQKQQQQERKEKEKKRTQKGERKR